jgi:signal transduction histidine kinase
LLQIQKPLPPAWADEVYLEQVLHNLLRNAARHSASGQVVIVEARIEGDGLAVTVSNHGPTITPEEQRRIFEAFYRGANEGNGDRHYGLGLYFASKLMEAQGGSVSVRSPAFDDVDCPGAAFTLLIPRAREEP